MSLNFAPYSNQPPDEQRRQAAGSDVPTSSANPSPGYEGGYQSSSSAGPQPAAWAARPSAAGTAPTAEAYETRFSWRVDVLAAAAYITPLPAIVLLVLETRNDYVRVHAYQSLLLALPLALVHFLLLWSSTLQYLLLVFDILAYSSLAYRAYLDADLLERRLLPTIGVLAEMWVEEE